MSRTTVQINKSLNAAKTSHFDNQPIYNFHLDSQQQQNKTRTLQIHMPVLGHLPTCKFEKQFRDIYEYNAKDFEGQN